MTRGSRVTCLPGLGGEVKAGHLATCLGKGGGITYLADPGEGSTGGGRGRITEFLLKMKIFFEMKLDTAIYCKVQAEMPFCDAVNEFVKQSFM